METQTKVVSCPECGAPIKVLTFATNFLGLMEVEGEFEVRAQECQCPYYMDVGRWRKQILQEATHRP